jgi:hypothetical protein
MINEVVDDQKACFAQKEDCGARYHLTDPRSTITYSSLLGFDKAVVPKYYFEALINIIMIGWPQHHEYRYIQKYAFESAKFLQCLKWVITAVKSWTEGSIPTAAKRWTDMYFSSPYFSDGSLVMKQIKKCKGEMANISHWKVLCEKLTDVAFYVTQNLDQSIMYAIGQRAIYLDQLLTGANPPITNFIVNYVLHPAQILDLYILGRSWKNPQDSGFNPALVVSYQGTAHSIAMAKVLSENNFYDVATAIPSQLENQEGQARCIKVNKSVNVDDIIDEIDRNREKSFAEQRNYYEGFVPSDDDDKMEDDWFQRPTIQPSLIKTKSRK